MRCDGFAFNPDFTRFFGASHRNLAQRVGAGDVVVRQGLFLRFVVELLFSEGLFDKTLVHPGVDVQRFDTVQTGQHLVPSFDGVEPAGFDAGVQGVNTARAEVEVGHLFFNLGPLFHLGGGGRGVAAHPGIGLHQGAYIGHYHLGVLGGKVFAHHHTVEGGHFGFSAIKNFACETAVRQQVGKRHEVGVAVDFFLLQIGGAHLGALAGQVPEVLGPAT